MMTVITDDETEVRRARRSWPAQYQLDILGEIDAAKESGETTVAEICRREGLGSSLISEWRKQRDEGALEGLTDRRPGRPKKDRTVAELARLRARVAQLEDELGTAHELSRRREKSRRSCRNCPAGAPNRTSRSDDRPDRSLGAPGRGRSSVPGVRGGLSRPPPNHSGNTSTTSLYPT